MDTNPINENNISLFLTINIFQYHFFIIFVQSHQIGNQPACIKARSVELGKFKVPLIDLEKVEFHVRYRLKLDIAFLYLIKKQSKKIRFKICRCVRFGLLIILKSLT